MKKALVLSVVLGLLASTASAQQGVAGTWLSASGVAQINGAMGQLNQTTQQNASASEELAATAEELGAQAQVVRQHFPR